MGPSAAPEVLERCRMSLEDLSADETIARVKVAILSEF
jgi:hypothetical protein